METIIITYMARFLMTLSSVKNSSLKDLNYQLKDSDIVNEIKGGYVIKVDGKYYVTLRMRLMRTIFGQKKRLNVRSRNTVIIMEAVLTIRR